jgi:Trk K+ transport system NAD-binding subunit
VVVGNDTQAALLAQRLANNHHEEKVILATAPGAAPVPVESINGITRTQLNEISSEALATTGAQGAKTLVALLDNDTDNLKLIQLARANLQIENLVARVNDPDNTEAYSTAGAYPVTVADSQVTVLENLASNPNVFRLFADTDQRQEVVELTVRDTALDGVPVHALRLPGKALIMVIQRDGRFIVPRGETKLSLYDRVTVLASHSEMDQVCRMFSAGPC